MGAQDFTIHGRRDQVTIMSDMLGILATPQRLTHILYRSNMSYGQLIKYIHEMKELELIKENSQPFRSFQITNKGKLFRGMLLGKKENNK